MHLALSQHQPAVPTEGGPMQNAKGTSDLQVDLQGTSDLQVYFKVL